jgi:hypothetical protein
MNDADWRACSNSSVMLLALAVLGDRRLMARGAQACLAEVDDLLDPGGRGLARLIARLAAGEVVDARAALLDAAALRAGHEPGARALATLAVCTAAELLDLDDPAPNLEGVSEAVADALVEAGRVESGAAGRARLARAIRAWIPTLPG